MNKGFNRNTYTPLAQVFHLHCKPRLNLKEEKENLRLQLNGAVSKREQNYGQRRKFDTFKTQQISISEQRKQ